MSVGTPHFDALPGFTPVSTLGPRRAADYFELPEGEPVELMRGRLIPKHKPIAGSSTSFKLACRATKHVLAAQLKGMLTFTGSNRRGLIVEVRSERNRRPRGMRMRNYARFGIQEYWFVDPIEEYVLFFVLDGATFKILTGLDNHYQSPRFPELSIDLAAFWREVAERLPQE
jgi:hypothetical protein